jgi:DNA-binding NarL/FixJ family response regulator
LHAPEEKVRIVIADDRPEVLAIIQQILQPEFEIVRAVTDGNALLKAVEDEHPTVVVSDVSMPGMTGIEALKRMRSRCKSAPPTIMLSAHNDPRLVENALNAGASGYVSKRRAPADLRAAVKAVLQGRRFVSEGLAAPPV